jgi:hypothetical protein
MEKKNNCVRLGCSRILWVVIAFLLCAAPCVSAFITVDGTNSPYVLETEVADYIEVTNVGTIQLMPGGYASLGVYVNAGGTINIYGSHTWTSEDTDIQIALSANVMLFTDSIDSIVLDPPDGATLVGTTIIVEDTTNGWTGNLTWDYNGVTYSLNISTLSDISVEVIGGGEPTPITIDIKPGSYPNAINLGSNGVVPVAILSTPDFLATTLNAENVFLAGSGVAVRGKGNKYLASQEDVNGDSLLDLVVKVETENLDPGTLQDGYAILQVIVENTVIYEGSDEITIVPPE